MTKTDKRLLSLNDKDNIYVIAQKLNKGEKLYVNGTLITIEQDINAGFKLAKNEISIGDNILKYGYVIGIATKQILLGEIIHFHNIKSTYMETTLTTEQKG